MQPNVEILMATYNGEKYLREQLDSLLKQTWENWHLTVSDDGSMDETIAIIDAYAAMNPERITRVRHIGRFGNARDHFFWLMKQSSAPYIMFCDQDDVWRLDKVERTMRALLKAEADVAQGTPMLVFTDLTPVDENLREIAPSLMRLQRQSFETSDYRSLLIQNTVSGCASGINRALALLAEQCMEPSKTIMHDWWLGILAARFGKMTYLDESTILYRQHDANSVGARDVRAPGYLLHKIFHLKDIRKAILDKKQQAACFLVTYESRLLPKDKAFLDVFSQKRSGMLFYLRYRKLFHGFLQFAGMLLLG